MQIIHRTPELEAVASRGNTKHWQGLVLTDDAGGAYTQTAYWQQTADGFSTKQFSAPTRIAGKNLGRANETTPLQQALAEMAATEQRQRDKGYHIFGEADADALLLPMLAHQWADRKHGVAYPLYAQPKLDGCRCLLCDGVMWSRQGKPFLPAVTRHLAFDTHGVILDGELMLPHLGYTFQETTKAIKKARPETVGLLEYHVYDAILPDEPGVGFTARYDTAYNLAVSSALGRQVYAVHTVRVDDEADVARWHAYYTHPDQGYEGTILRSPNGVYMPGHRSHDLLKHKDMLDAEFEIVGVGEGKGKFAGAIMFTCRTAAGLLFDCGLRGAMDDRREMFGRKESFVGQRLTVKYQNLTDDGLPRFPVGLAVRDPATQGGG